MSQRAFYIAAYDVTHPKRLAATMKVVREFSTGGQKSVYECFLSESERCEMITRLQDCLDPDEDRFALIRLDPRSRVFSLGIAVDPTDPDFYYVG